MAGRQWPSTPGVSSRRSDQVEHAIFENELHGGGAPLQLRRSVGAAGGGRSFRPGKAASTGSGGGPPTHGTTDCRATSCLAATAVRRTAAPADDISRKPQCNSSAASDRGKACKRPIRKHCPLGSASPMGGRQTGERIDEDRGCSGGGGLRRRQLCPSIPRGRKATRLPAARARVRARQHHHARGLAEALVGAQVVASASADAAVVGGRGRCWNSSRASSLVSASAAKPAPASGISVAPRRWSAPSACPSAATFGAIAGRGRRSGQGVRPLSPTPILRAGTVLRVRGRHRAVEVRRRRRVSWLTPPALLRPVACGRRRRRATRPLLRSGTATSRTARSRGRAGPEPLPLSASSPGRSCAAKAVAAVQSVIADVRARYFGAARDDRSLTPRRSPR